MGGTAGADACSTRANVSTCCAAARRPPSSRQGGRQGRRPAATCNPPPLPRGRSGAHLHPPCQRPAASRAGSAPAPPCDGWPGRRRTRNGTPAPPARLGEGAREKERWGRGRQERGRDASQEQRVAAPPLAHHHHPPTHHFLPHNALDVALHELRRQRLLEGVVVLPRQRGAEVAADEREGRGGSRRSMPRRLLRQRLEHVQEAWGVQRGGCVGNAAERAATALCCTHVHPAPVQARAPGSLVGRRARQRQLVPRQLLENGVVGWVQLQGGCRRRLRHRCRRRRLGCRAREEGSARTGWEC